MFKFIGTPGPYIQQAQNQQDVQGINSFQTQQGVQGFNSVQTQQQRSKKLYFSKNQSFSKKPKHFFVFYSLKASFLFYSFRVYQKLSFLS